jgi:acyl carrier protein
MRTTLLAQIQCDINEIFREILEIPSERSLDGLTMLNEPKWDSLAMVSIVAAIESKFNVMLNSTDFDHMTSIASTYLMIIEKLGLEQ